MNHDTLLPASLVWALTRCSVAHAELTTTASCWNLMSESSSCLFVGWHKRSILPRCHSWLSSSYIARAPSTEPLCVLRYDPYASALQHDARDVPRPVTGAVSRLSYAQSDLGHVQMQCDTVVGSRHLCWFKNASLRVILDVPAQDL